MFDIRRKTVFLFGMSFSKHIMARYAKNFEGIRPGHPLSTPMKLIFHFMVNLSPVRVGTVLCCCAKTISTYETSLYLQPFLDEVIRYALSVSGWEKSFPRRVVLSSEA